MRFSLTPWIAIVSAAMIAGCAMAPPLPTIETTAGDRIGILVDVGDAPSHTHIGTTAFNNFTRKYPYDWKMRAEIKRIVERSVSNAGLTPVDLDALGIAYADVADLIRPDGDTWQIAPGRDGALHRLRSEHRLKAVVVLKESRSMTALECGGGPCSERYADASGLYTRGFFGSTTYHAIAAYRWNVFVLDPVADVARADPLWSMLRIPAPRLRGFKDPANFKEITEAELAPVRDEILRFTESMSAEAMRTLRAK